jgi:hypothetical protein
MYGLRLTGMCGLRGLMLFTVFGCRSGGDTQAVGPSPAGKEPEKKYRVTEEDKFYTASRKPLQEWLDHQSNAWVPVAVLSDAVTRWPPGVAAESIDVTHEEFTVRVQSPESVDLLMSSLGGSPWLAKLSHDGTAVSGRLHRVERDLAPETAEAVEAMIGTLVETHVFGTSPGVEERNAEAMSWQVTSLFNCWDKSRSDTPRVQVGEWSSNGWVQSGSRFSRSGASVEVKGPFPAVLNGLDCARSSGWRLAVQALKFKSEASPSRDVVLNLEVALIEDALKRTAGEPVSGLAPWSAADLWGTASRPERKRVLKDRTVVDPFKR